MNIQATLSDIQFSDDKSKTFGKVTLINEADLTTSVVYDFTIDCTGGKIFYTLFVEKDTVRLIGAAYFSSSNFRSVSDFKRTIYWMVWTLVRQARPHDQWNTPSAMRFSVRHPDTAKEIMKPNTVSRPVPHAPATLRYLAPPLRLTLPPLKRKL